MSRNRLGLSTGLTALMAAAIAAPLPVAAQPAAYGVPQPQQQCEEKGGHPTIGAVAGGLAGAALGASLGLQIGAMLGGELGGRIGRTKCKPIGQGGPAYAVYPQAYAPAPYQQPYGYPQPAYPQQAYAQPTYPQAAYPQAAYPQAAYPQPVYQAPAYPQAAPPPGYAARAYGVWPYGDVYVTPAVSGRRRGS